MFFSARASFGRACSFRPACCPRNRPTVRAANHHQKHLTHVKPQRPDKVATSHPPKARSMAPALRLKVSRWLAVQRNQPVVRVVVRSHRLRRNSENNWTTRSAQCVDTNADDHSRKRAQLNCRCCWRGRKCGFLTARRKCTLPRFYRGKPVRPQIATRYRSGRCCRPAQTGAIGRGRGVCGYRPYKSKYQPCRTSPLRPATETHWA